MDLPLTPEFERLIERRVRSGRYGTAAEVVYDALRLLIDQDKKELQKRELNAKLGEAMASLRRGDGIDGEEFFRQLELDESELANDPQ